MTVTITEQDSGGIKQLTFAFTTDGGGAASGTTSGSYVGIAAQVTFVSTAGSVPTTGYTATIKNAAAVDVLGSAAASVPSANPVTYLGRDGLTSLGASGTLTLAISNGGATKSGTVTLLIQPLNDYCTLTQIKGRLDPNGTTTLAIDDMAILEMIDEASRAIDTFCGGRTFFARAAEVRLFDRPGNRQLDFDDDLLAVTTLLNGDGSTITSASYKLYPANETVKHWLTLTITSGIIWLVDTSGQSMQAISLTGTWGYVDRTATDFRSLQIIRATEHACIETVVAVYQSRYGENATFNTIVTPSGMVITPRDIPGWVQKYIQAYGKPY